MGIIAPVSPSLAVSSSIGGPLGRGPLGTGGGPLGTMGGPLGTGGGPLGTGGGPLGTVGGPLGGPLGIINITIIRVS